MSDLIRRKDALALRDKLADIIGALPMSSIHSALSEYRNAIRALPAVQPGKEVMPDGTSKVWNHDAAPASTDDAGRGAWDAMLHGMGVTLGGQHVPIDKVFAVAKPDRERVAFSMWKAEADRAAPNVGKHRTLEGFRVAADAEREKWLGLADAAIRALKGESHE